MRRTSSSEDREIEREIAESLKTSNYLDKVLEAISTGEKLETVGVPNFKIPGGGADPTADLPQEHIDLDSLLGNISPENLQGFEKSSSGQTTTKPKTRITPQYEFAISRNQMNAINKFPSLIDFLGQKEGEAIAIKIASECNKIISTKLEANAKQVNKYAKICESDRKNMRQYFEGENWLCRVTASGDFNGDEAIYYNHKKDKSFVLRKSCHNYVDVTEEFNVIHDFAEKKEEE